MRKFVAIITILILFTLPAIGSAEIYPNTMFVIDLDETNDEVICIDFNGNTWSFSGIEDWAIGDIVSMIMDNNNTPQTIYDDSIMQVRYSGWIEWND